MQHAIPSLISEKIRSRRASKMFFLGHMCWAYAFGKATSYLTSRKIKVQLALLCGIMPDIDLFLNIEHGGIMHSIYFWIVAYIPVLLWIGPRRCLPYLVSTLQHPLFGDFIAAKYKILIPFSYEGFGLGLGIMSPITLSFELAGFLIFIIISYFTKDLALLFSINSENLISILPAVAMFVSYELILGMEGWSYFTHVFEFAQMIFLFLLLSSFFMGLYEEISKIYRRYK